MPSLAAFFIASCLVAGIGLSAWDWWHCWRRSDRQVSKLAPMYVAISAVIVMMMHVNADPSMSLVDAGMWWLLGGLIASIVGDAFLLPPRQFVAGLAAFLVAHLCLAVYFWHWAAWLEPGVIGVTGTLLAAAALTVVPGATFVAKVPRAELIPVLCYLLAIGFMVATAINTARPLVIAGAALFAVSDYLLARERYVPQSKVNGVQIMATYHIAQWCFVLATALAVRVFG